MTIPELNVPELSLTTITYPLTKSNTLVIGSGHSRVAETYHKILANEFKIDSNFCSLNHGLIESLANDAEKDRVQSLKLLTKNMAKKIEQIIIFTDICIGEKDEEIYMAKRERRKNAALKAKDCIHHLFRDRHPNLKIYCYIITVDGEKKVVDRIARNIEEFEEEPRGSKQAEAQAV